MLFTKTFAATTALAIVGLVAANVIFVGGVSAGDSIGALLCSSVVAYAAHLSLQRTTDA